LSRRHVELLAGAAAEGITPIEYMLQILRDENAPEERRSWAAEKSAPYIHPKPQPIARCVELVLPDTSTVEGIKAALSVITAAAASGQIAPAEAQSLSALVEAQRKGIETGELLDRIERLEAGPVQKELPTVPARLLEEGTGRAQKEA
jgi:hypothetical protein